MNIDNLRHMIERSLTAQQRFRDRWPAYSVDETQHLSMETVDGILGELEERLNDNYPFFHPRYAGQMLKPPHPIAMAAYLMAMQINPNNHALDGGPATAKMEMEAVGMLAAMFGYGEHGGHLTSSGTIANLEALWIARSIHPEKEIAYSPNAHYTHQRMCDVLKIRSKEIDLTRLDVLEDHLKQGTIGTIVVTIGTTGTGSVEPLDDILPLAKHYGVRVHADCAYGGFFMLLAKATNPIIRKEPFLVLHDCDSIVLDPHKHGLQPYGCGCVLFKDPGVGKFYKHDSPYTYFTSKELHLGEISLECSRAGASAAALWATLKAFPLHPENGFGAFLKQTRLAALRWSRMLKDTTKLKEYCPPDLDIVVFYPQTSPFSASVVSKQSQEAMHTLMTRNPSPLYLAGYTVDSSAIARQCRDFSSDQPKTTILRSVLMKPDHGRFVETLFREILEYFHRQA